jgi:polar amino acid transport system substrate-binding protein
VGSCLDYPPFESVKNGEPTGFDVDIATEIATRLDLEVEFIKANFDNIFTDLAGGKFDMVAAASTITEERLQIVDFSDPYFNSRQGLTVNTDETPDIKTTDDLGEGDVVGAQKGTTGLDWAKENLASQGVEIRTFDAAPEAFTQLEGGAITAVVNDEGSSIAEVEQRSGLEVVQAIDTEEKYGLALSKDNTELTDAINGALAEMIEDGTYEQLFTKYFPDLPVPDEFKAA